MQRKKQEIILEREYTPPWESDSEPDSEAMRLRRRREGFPFPEAVALLERFLKEAEQKIEETEGYYSRPGKLLTHEEMYAFDRKILGIAAIRRRVGEKMKKLEEDSWKEMEEILEGGRMENERDERRFSYLLTIVPPSRDPASIIDQLKVIDFPYKMEPTFEGLASFAKIYAMKDEECTKVQEQIDNNVLVNTVQASSGESMTNPLHLLGKLEQKRLAVSRYKEAAVPEAKKEMKEEEDVEITERGENTAKDQPSGVEKESPKRKEWENAKEGGTSGDKMKARNEKPSEVAVKEEELESDCGENVVTTPELPMDADEDFHQNEVDFHDDYDDLNEMGPPPGGLDPNDRSDQWNEEGLGEVSDRELSKPTKRRRIVESEEEKDSSEAELGDALDFNETQSHLQEKFVRRSKRQTKRVTYAIVKNRKDESSEDDGSSESDLEEQSETLPHRGTIICEGEAPDNDQQDEEMNQTVDKHDSVDHVIRECVVVGCSEKFASSEDLIKHMKKHLPPVSCGVCKRVFKTRVDLRKHYRSHTGERPYKCAICKKTFSRSTTLKTHQLVHSGVRPFECDMCDYKASRLSHLKDHKRTHTGERPYECDVCGFKCSTSSYMKTHKRIHTGEKPFSCTKCGYKTGESSHLSAHKKTHPR